MATCSGENTRTVIVEDTKDATPEQTPSLRLRDPKSSKKLQWAEGTVDNEGMGKKSSKCCCVYKKPRMFGESSSEDDSDDDGDGGEHEGDKCKAPKDYHKKSKKKHAHDEHCNTCP